MGPQGCKILSCFDGMACGMLAMMSAGVQVERYVAYEIDKYAIATATHNFPQIEEMGDVFKADFTQYRDFDFLVGGSPCTYWSIAQTQHRETTASGLGWELFSQYVRALRESQPRYFIYENNKSMSQEIRRCISETFGFEPVCINSALVSAQNRQRLYWVGIRQNDGTYRKADVEQPADRGILLKDILDGNGNNLTGREMDYMVRDHQDRRWNFTNKPGEKDKSECVTANIARGIPYNVVAERIPDYSTQDKSRPVQASYKNKGVGEASLQSEAFPESPAKQVRDYVAEPIQVGAMPRPNGELSTSQGFRIYSPEGKAVTVKGLSGGAGGKTGLYALPEEKGQKIYHVENGLITIRDRQYPIKLKDGDYIVRKLSVDECKRLQTVPEWYDFPVSNSQAYKMIGNGWTVEVIAHLIRSALK